MRNPALSESSLIQVDADGNVREANGNIRADATTTESPVKMDPCLTTAPPQQQYIHSSELIVIDSSDDDDEDDDEGEDEGMEEHMEGAEQTSRLVPPPPVTNNDAERNIIRVRSEPTANIFNPPPQTMSSRPPPTVRPPTISIPVASG